MIQSRYDRTRVNGFIDAVYAIAMTLLILDVPVPDLDRTQEFGFWNSMQYGTAHLIGYVVSFLVIAGYWIAHVRLTHFVRYYTTRLLWHYIIVLFLVVLLAYTTALYCTYFTLDTAFRLYCWNLVALGLLSSLSVYRVRQQEGLKHRFTPATYRYLLTRSLIVPVIWGIAGLLTFLLPDNLVTRFLFVAIFPLNFLVDRMFKKKVKQEQADHERLHKPKRKHKHPRKPKPATHQHQESAVAPSPEVTPPKPDRKKHRKPRKPSRNPGLQNS